MLARFKIILDDRTNRIVNGLVIFSIVAIFSLRNMIFFKALKYVFTAPDHIQHFCLTVVFRDCLHDAFFSAHFFKNIYKMVEFINIYFRRPPLYYFMAVTLNFFINNLILTQQYVLPLIFFIITIIYTFRLSEYITKDSGIYSILLLAIFPAMILHTQGITLYAGQIATFILAFYYFLRSDFFEKRKESVVFGLAFGWGMLMKEQFPVFFIGPFFIAALVFLKKKKKFNLTSFGLFLISFFVSGALFFIPFQFLGYVNHEPFMPTLSNFTFQLSAYWEGLMYDLTPPLAGIFIFVALNSLLKKRMLEIVLISSLAGAVFIFSFFSIRFAKTASWYYISPCLPLIATTIGVYFKKYGKALFAYVLFVALLIYPLSFCNINKKNDYSDSLTDRIMNYMASNDSEYRRMLFWSVESSLWSKELPQGLRGIVNFISSRNLYSRYIGNYLREVAKELNCNFHIGILRQSGASLLAGDLQAYLKNNGFSDCIGGVGFPNADLYLNKDSYDVFIYINDSRFLTWPTEEILSNQVDQLLAERKKEVTKEDINRFLKLEDEMKRVGISPYLLNEEDEFSYVHVFLNKKIASPKDTDKIIQ